jgi:hypothetical protein
VLLPLLALPPSLALPPFLPTSLALPLLLPTLLLLPLRHCCFAGAAKFASTATFAGTAAFAAAFTTGAVAVPLLLCHCCLCWLCCNPAATFAGGSPLGLPLVMLEGLPLVLLEGSLLTQDAGRIST